MAMFKLVSILEQGLNCTVQTHQGLYGNIGVWTTVGSSSNNDTYVLHRISKARIL